MVESQSMLTIWRRHSKNCPHRDKGRDYLKCNCPIWADGYVNGKRTLFRSLKTRDMARARKRAADLENPDQPNTQTVREAVSVFNAHGVANGLRPSTLRKRTNVLAHLEAFCEAQGLVDLNEITIERLAAYRAARGIALITSAKELELLRQFFKFCYVRRWIRENPASKLEAPRNIKPNKVEPYTPAEVEAMIAACDCFGRRAFERLRARAMVLTMRYTGLRIGDVALLAKERISREGSRWRIFLHTEKSGKPVFLPIPDELRLALNKVPTPRGASPDCRYYFWNGRQGERAAKGSVERTLRKVFRLALVARAHAHRFRHTLATELLGAGATFEEVADVLGNSPAIVRKHYAKWSTARQARIDNLMDSVWKQFGNTKNNGLQVIGNKEYVWGG
jgi:integrase/recombinase XerC